MGIGYNTQKKWVFGYGYWVSCGYHTQYPIPIKKVGTDVCFEVRTSVATEASNVSIPSVSSADSIAQLLLYFDPVDRAAVTDEIAKISMQKDKVQFLVEISKFTSLTDPKAIKKLALQSTANFWTSKGGQFPTLYKLTLILYNVPSSSAFIERFYSVCGNV
jgi:hypothetical protein